MDFLKLLRLQWDRVAAWVAVALGAIALLLGYRGVSDTPYLVEQLPYIVSGAVLGIFALGIGAMLWLSADLRDEWRKLDELERLVAIGLERFEASAALDPKADSRELVKDRRARPVKVRV